MVGENERIQDRGERSTFGKKREQLCKMLRSLNKRNRGDAADETYDSITDKFDRNERFRNSMIAVPWGDGFRDRTWCEYVDARDIRAIFPDAEGGPATWDSEPKTLSRQKRVELGLVTKTTLDTADANAPVRRVTARTELALSLIHI